MKFQSKVGVILAEFFGTALLTSTILAQANSNVLVNRNWFISITAGLTLALLVLIIGSVSGAHVNPAVTVGLWTLHKIESATAVVYIAAQMLGAAVALKLFEYFQNDALQNIAGKFEWRIFAAETVGTFIFAFGIAAVVTQKLSGYRAAFATGASLALGALVASSASNGILNPAVALGLNSWSWAYAAAPFLGAILGIQLYDIFLAPEKSAGNTKSKVVSSVKDVKKSGKK